MAAAEAAGAALAHALLERAQGSRPVTLVGSSFGALVVVEALRQMGGRSHCQGIVENVYLFGAPVSGASSKWKAVTPLIAGRLINCHSTNDWVLKLMMRGMGADLTVAGLDGIASPRADNVDVSSLVGKHSDWLLRSSDLLDLVGLTSEFARTPGVGVVGQRVKVAEIGTGILR